MKPQNQEPNNFSETLWSKVVGMRGAGHPQVVLSRRRLGAGLGGLLEKGDHAAVGDAGSARRSSSGCTGRARSSTGPSRRSSAAAGTTPRC